MDKKICEKLERIFRNSKVKTNPAIIKYPFDDTNGANLKKGYQLSFKMVHENPTKYNFYFLPVDSDQTYDTINLGLISGLSNGKDVLSRKEISIIVEYHKEYLEPLKDFWFGNVKY
jgi:hypothetical protein